MKKEKIDLIKSAITTIELSLDQIKKDVELIKFLTESINGIVASIDYYSIEIKNKIKELKIRLGIKNGEEFE
jgi:hypothetical protein